MYFKNEFSYEEIKKTLTELSKELKFARKDEVSIHMK